MLGWQESFSSAELASKMLLITRYLKEKMDILQVLLLLKLLVVPHLGKKFSRKFNELWEIWQIKTAQFFVAQPLSLH